MPFARKTAKTAAASVFAKDREDGGGVGRRHDAGQ
jgi:hypothetical protein